MRRVYEGPHSDAGRLPFAVSPAAPWVQMAEDVFPDRTAASRMSNTQPSTTSSDLPERVGQIIDLIRPAIQADGGDVEFVDVTSSGVVRIRLLGACVGCPSATMTLRLGIEKNLKDNIPEVSGVEAVA